MKTTTAPTINRLTTVEEELTDRIFREKNGKMVFNFCEKLAELLMPGYSQNDRSNSGLRDKLYANLRETLKCNGKQAASLIELSLELIHTRLHGTYRSNVELSLLIATATGAVREVSSN